MEQIVKEKTATIDKGVIDQLREELARLQLRPFPDFRITTRSRGTPERIMSAEKLERLLKQPGGIAKKHADRYRNGHK